MEALLLEHVGISIKGASIVSDVSFSAVEGEIIAVIGPNGAGKTTLMKAVLGLVPYNGKISVFGEEHKKAAGKIGYVPQRFSFDRSFPITVGEFLSLSAPEGEVSRFLEETGMIRFRDRQLGSLSGGETQRVLITRAVMGHPKLLLLDEATSGVDIEGVRDFYEMIRFVRDNYGMTILMVSHEINAVSKLADKVICLNRNMVCHGGPNEALTQEMMEKLYGSEVGLRGHTHGT
ncbi:MAG: metal ABC transporter ATP-binding protein [Candidatus Colwellbacteria bacterium]|nr:metal ABC transporter ATP-binding protein [Candidatus Colwellbacteria bacterium]